MLLQVISVKLSTMILRWRLLLHAARGLNDLLSHLTQSPTSFWISPMTCLGHLLVVNLISIHRWVESPLAENGDLGEHFFWMLSGLISLNRPITSFGPGRFKYQAFACYDLLDGGKQKLSEYGVWTGNMYVFSIVQPLPTT